jgi:hypothetical protein
MLLFLLFYQVGTDFPSMDGISMPWWVGALLMLLTSVGTLLGVFAKQVIPALVQWLHGRAEEKRADKALRAKIEQDAFTLAMEQVRSVMAQVQEQMNRHQKIEDERAGAMSRLHEFYTDCREESAECRQTVEFLYGLVQSQHTILLRHHLTEGDLPHLPKLREKRRERDPEFLQRSVQQDSTLVKEYDTHSLELLRTAARAAERAIEHGQNSAGRGPA